MKVGILSMHQITNYGSFLQAYGLKAMIEDMGHDVEFIDIIPGEQLPQYKRGRLHTIKLLSKRLMVKHPFKQLKSILKLHKRFDNEFKPELRIKSNYNHSTDTDFDLVVIGSDEVFNFAQKSWFGFSPQLFGEGIKASKIISYAGCFGATTIDVINNLGLTTRLKSLLRNFDTISVRDENSLNIIKSLTGKQPFLNSDPVIVYPFAKELKLLPEEKSYLLLYTYPARIKNKEEIHAIKSFANDKNLKIISIGNYFDWVDTTVTPHPFEVLGYFQKATFVITDTFHGTVLSIKYNKPFATLVREMNSNKISFLLKQYNLEDRKVRNISDIQKILDKRIDYSPVNSTIQKERNHAIDYLQQNL